MKKLFVSSTFKDMQLERDALKNHVIPDLNVRLREYGTKIGQTDLRWGISTSELSAEAGEQKILNVCLDEINKSRPYMIVMLGERYGWIPSPAIIEMNARGRGLTLESCDISVTQLEIEYIAFAERYDSSRIFFYFRELDCSGMDGATRAVYEAESDVAREKLARLKARIEAAFPNQIRHYSLRYEDGEIRGIEGFERLVTGDLYSLFDRDMKEDEKLDVNVRVRKKLHGEALESFAFYLPEHDIGNDCKSGLACADKSAAEMTHTYIGGSPQCGKSTSVMARYMALYAYQHRHEPCWELAKPLFRPDKLPIDGGGIFKEWPKSFDAEGAFPLYLQIGNCKDIRDEADFLRTFLYFLREQLGDGREVPTAKRELIGALCESLRELCRTDKTFYLFVDDLTPEALADLWAIEHAFSKEEIPRLMKHFLFYASFDNSFDRVPVYVPFFEYSLRSIERTEVYAPAEYFFSYARKLGKELSAGVVNYIVGYYGGYGRTFDDAQLTHITRKHANLMANYFTNFTAEDYAKIKAAGNDMNAIEARQLELLRAVRGNFSDDMSGESLRRVVVLNIEKFEPNHDSATLRMLGIIYILSGVSFSMEEAREIFAFFGEEWSDLEYVSYFDDFKEFFVYNSDEDSYRVLPAFQDMLRRHLIERHLCREGAIEAAVERLICAVQSTEFYESKRRELFLTALLVPNSRFLTECIMRLSSGNESEYDLGKTVGAETTKLLKTLSVEGARSLGLTLSPVICKNLSYDAVCGFFDGIGGGFQDHDYERRILALADALASELQSADRAIRAAVHVSLSMMRAHCYIGWKNDKAIAILLEAEPYLEDVGVDERIGHLALLASLIENFEPGSPMFELLSFTVRSHLPSWEPTDDMGERALSLRADAFSLAFFVKKLSLAADYLDPDMLIEPFLSGEHFSKMGLRNAAAAIYAQDARKIGMDTLLSRLRTFMVSLSTAYPSSHYSSRLISACMRAAFFAATVLYPQDNAMLEKHFYPYQKAELLSRDGSVYSYCSYALFLRNARYFHGKTGITHSMDEELWEATNMGYWYGAFDDVDEASLELVLRVCWSYISYLQDPGFHDMMTSNAAREARRLGEEGESEPSIKAIHYRLTVTLAAVLHNPASRIMKPKLKRLFKTLEEHYGDYMTSLSDGYYKAVKKFITEI